MGRFFFYRKPPPRPTSLTTTMLNLLPKLMFGAICILKIELKCHLFAFLSRTLFQMTGIFWHPAN